VEVTTTGYYRQLEIKDKAIEKRIADFYKKQTIHQFVESDFYHAFNTMTLLTKRKVMRAKIDLFGVGISIVDKEPREILYLSIYKIKADFSQETIEKGQTG